MICFQMTTRTAIYARASPDCPLSLEEQLACLRSVAIERGWTVEHVFADRPTTVRKGQDRRSERSRWSRLSAAARSTEYWSVVCRIGKSFTDLVGFMETCRAPASRSICTTRILIARPRMVCRCSMSRLVAHHLRQSRRNNILRGQAAARALSIRFGRPRDRGRKVEKAKRELAAGKGVRQVARIAGISPASVSKSRPR